MNHIFLSSSTWPLPNRSLVTKPPNIPLPGTNTQPVLPVISSQSPDTQLELPSKAWICTCLVIAGLGLGVSLGRAYLRKQDQAPPPEGNLPVDKPRSEKLGLDSQNNSGSGTPTAPVASRSRWLGARGRNSSPSGSGVDRDASSSPAPGQPLDSLGAGGSSENQGSASSEDLIMSSSGSGDDGDGSPSKFPRLPLERIPKNKDDGCLRKRVLGRSLNMELSDRKYWLIASLDGLLKRVASDKRFSNMWLERRRPQKEGESDKAYINYLEETLVKHFTDLSTRGFLRIDEKGKREWLPPT